jgi:hypothetical protein
MNAEQNELLTRITPGTPCGKLLRQYWQPAALVDEFNPALDPRMEIRPVKALKLFGQDLVLFKDASGAWGLLDRDCAHRGADLSFGRRESAARAAACAALSTAGSSPPTAAAWKRRPSPRAASCASAYASAATRC